LHLEEALAPGNVAQLLKELCGVQAQDPFSALLAVWVRSSGLRASDVEHTRVHERSIVRTWCMRGTLHLLTAEDLGWLQPLLGPGLIRKSRRRYAQLGLDEELCKRTTDSIRSILGERGPMTRAELAEQLAAQGIPTEGQAAYHLVRRAALEGAICFGPDREGEPTYVALADWVTTGEALEGDAAYAELAGRYLEAYGPAGPEDLATWSGLSRTEARTGLGMISSELLEVDIAGSSAWIPRIRRAWLDEPQTDKVVVRLLPSYDPYLLGFRGRDLTVPKQHAKRIHPGGGVLRPTLLVDGRAAGTWKIKKSSRGHSVTVEPFESLAPEIVQALEDQVQELGRFLEVKATLKVLPPTVQH
jgi:hypothetical protein